MSALIDEPPGKELFRKVYCGEVATDHPAAKTLRGVIVELERLARMASGDPPLTEDDLAHRMARMAEIATGYGDAVRAAWSIVHADIANDTLRAKIADLHGSIAARAALTTRDLSAIDGLRAQFTIHCVACGERHRICDTHAIQTRWYTRPHGCTEGDYWSDGELRVVCPETGVHNRLLFDNTDVPWEDRRKYDLDPEQQFRHLYKHLFKSCASKSNDELDREGYRWVNNYHVDQNRTLFGLVEKRKTERTA